jgi:hypothetical protein
MLHRPTDRWTIVWAAVLGALVAFRVGLPAVVKAHSGSALPLLPRYDYVPLNGDANGYYEAVSNIIDSYEHVVRPHWQLLALGLSAVWAGSVALAVLRPRLRWLGLVAAAAAFAAVVAYVIHDVAPPGAPVIGWPLLWTLSLLRFPRWHELTVEYAFPYAFGLSLAANTVTTVATAYLGRFATGRRSVGLVAAALYAFWPVWVGLVAGERAWENGQWHTDIGLHLYTEPASTALVVAGAALLLKPALTETRAAGAGLALGYSAVVKLTNGLLAAAFLPLLAVRYGLRAALPYALACLVSLPILLVYWPKGYVKMYGGGIAPVPTPWSIDYVRLSWERSTVFTPAMVLILGVPATAGAVLVSGWYTRLALILPIVITAAVYSLYYVTYQHPRFLFVALPFVFVLVGVTLDRLVRLAWSRGASAAGPALGPAH